MSWPWNHDPRHSLQGPAPCGAVEKVSAGTAGVVAAGGSVPQARWALRVLCLALSLLIHALVLLPRWQGGGERSRGEVTGGAERESLVMVTSLDMPPPTNPSPVDATLNSTAAPVESSTPASSASEAAIPATPEPRPDPTPAVAGTPEAVVGSERQTGWQGASEYVPRKLLSVAPEPGETVVVPYPPEVIGAGRYAGIFSIFIDETGIVQFVKMEDPPLPSAMEEAVRRAFMQVRFSPGQRNGERVKSVIKVEMVFETAT